MRLSERDRKILWHPFTQEKTASPPIPVIRAEGSWLYGENGKKWLDLVSSWWVNLHGHAYPEIAEAIYKQAMHLEHVIFAGFTHDPAVTLCEKLQEVLPDSLCRFFFSDNGSTAIEVALKMAYQYWWNQGERQKKYFIALEGGYHGDTFGAMSVGARSGFHDPYSGLLFKVLHVPFPDTFAGDDEVSDKEQRDLLELENVLDKYQDKIVGIILEPIVQGASGMRMCRPEFVSQLVQRVREENILVIFDEVMTGFGRTGTLFALEQTGVTPDFLCLSKGITGGFLPLALTVTTEEVYSAFLGEHFSSAFAHGHSYTANPLGCAAGIMSLNILQRPESADARKSIQQALERGLADISKISKKICRVRQQGLIAAFDIDPAAGIDMQKFKLMMMEEGFLIRPLGQSVYLMPPYSTTANEIDAAFDKMRIVIAAS